MKNLATRTGIPVNRILKIIVSSALGSAATGVVLLGIPGCSHGDLKSGTLNAQGPTVLSAHGEPGVVELNHYLQPIQRPIVVAEIKDFKSDITHVVLQFKNAPITVPMHYIGGTQWEAELTPRQLEQMAVSGHTVHYEAVVVAQDAAGDTGTSQSPVSIAVKAPNADEA